MKDRIGLNQPAKEITGRDLDGRPTSFSDLEGSVVLVDFWAEPYGYWAGSWDA